MWYHFSGTLECTEGLQQEAWVVNCSQFWSISALISAEAVITPSSPVVGSCMCYTFMQFVRSGTGGKTLPSKYWGSYSDHSWLLSIKEMQPQRQQPPSLHLHPTSLLLAPTHTARVISSAAMFQ